MICIDRSRYADYELAEKGGYAGAAKVGGEMYRRFRESSKLHHMATQAQGTELTVSVYLNERYIPIRGWSSGHLLPTDREMFSHQDGCSDKYQGERHCPPAPDQLQLPESWQYTSDWVSSQGQEGFDKDGFEYAFNWSRNPADYKPSSSFSSCVRRRRYTRTCVRITPHHGAVSIPSRPVLAWRNSNGVIDVADPNYGRELTFVPIAEVRLEPCISTGARSISTTSVDQLGIPSVLCSPAGCTNVDHPPRLVRY